VVEPGGGSVRLPMLRQQTPSRGRPNRCLADFLAPARTTSAGSPSPSTVPTSWPQLRSPRRRLLLDHGQALADRFAEAFAEHIHLLARRDWYEPDATPDPDHLLPSGSVVSAGLRLSACPTTAPSESCSTA